MVRVERRTGKFDQPVELGLRLLQIEEHIEPLAAGTDPRERRDECAFAQIRERTIEEWVRVRGRIAEDVAPSVLLPNPHRARLAFKGPPRSIRPQQAPNRPGSAVRLARGRPRQLLEAGRTGDNERKLD